MQLTCRDSKSNPKLPHSAECVMMIGDIQILKCCTWCFNVSQDVAGTHLVQGQHHEGSSAAGVHNHGHEFGVNGAEVAVPRHLGDADVIVALISFQSLTKDVTKLTASHNLPGHGELETIGDRTLCVQSQRGAKPRCNNSVNS